MADSWRTSIRVWSMPNCNKSSCGSARFTFQILELMDSMTVMSMSRGALFCSGWFQCRMTSIATMGLSLLRSMNDLAFCDAVFPAYTSWQLRIYEFQYSMDSLHMM